MRPADKQRAYRKRQRNGEHVYPVKANGRVVEALIRRGMSDSDSRNRRKVAAELGAVLDQWADVWLK